MKQTNTPALGTKGCLIDTFDGTYQFRVYNIDGTFKDYNLHHCDLMITIDDSDAAFYEYEDGRLTLDHSSNTLGRK
jgi:hypothetical protein